MCIAKYAGKVLIFQKESIILRDFGLIFLKFPREFQKESIILRDFGLIFSNFSENRENTKFRIFKILENFGKFSEFLQFFFWILGPAGLGACSSGLGSLQVPRPQPEASVCVCVCVRRIERVRGSRDCLLFFSITCGWSTLAAVDRRA